MEEKLKSQEKVLSDDIVNLNKKAGFIFCLSRTRLHLPPPVEVPREAVQRCTVPTSRYCEFLYQSFLKKSSNI